MPDRLMASPDGLMAALPQVSFEHFLWLADGYANPEGATFYLQKHAMHKWAQSGLQVLQLTRV